MKFKIKSNISSIFLLLYYHYILRNPPLLFPLVLNTNKKKTVIIKIYLDFSRLLSYCELKKTVYALIIIKKKEKQQKNYKKKIMEIIKIIEKTKDNLFNINFFVSP